MLEKSCGTISYTVKNGTVLYLLVKTKNDRNCGFPKGHVEGGETEEETAIRETWEETSVIPRIIQGFRRQTEYRLNNGNTKTVVYFLACFNDQIPNHNEDYEDLYCSVLPFDEAYRNLTYKNTKKILKEADEYIRRHGLDR